MENHGKALLAALTLSAVMSANTAFATETYHSDQGHTEVHFAWDHAGVSMQSGEFTDVQGELVLDPDNVENSTLSVTINAASVSSGYERLDEVLKSRRWLEVETYPEITFTSTSVKRTGEKTAEVTGDLTLHGVTKPVTFNATLTHLGSHPVGRFIESYKGKWAAFSASTKIDHQAFKVGAYSTGPISISIVTEMKAEE